MSNELTPEAEEWIKEQEDALYEFQVDMDYIKGFVDGTKTAIENERLLQAQGLFTREWISVEEPPKEDGKYLIWNNGWDEAYFRNGKWIDSQPTQKSTSPYLKSIFRQQTYPTHWMPLPTPPDSQNKTKDNE